jgi:hypothetical protein
MDLLSDRYAREIAGTISCLDRVVVQGTLPTINHDRAMTSLLYDRSIRIFDFARFAEPFRHAIRKNAETVAEEHDIAIQHVPNSKERKEDIVARVLRKRGDHPGLVHIISAMEGCASYKPWHDKRTHKTFVKRIPGKCLHYYFYIMDPELGLCHIRVPTWLPFRVQVCFNGHFWLANCLDRKGIGYTLHDNAFTAIDDYAKAQAISHSFSPAWLHSVLDTFVSLTCPVSEDFGRYHWSIMQAECAMDIIFNRRADLQPVYDELVKTAIHTVKTEDIATFLGRRLSPRFDGEAGSNYGVRIQGTRIRHQMGNTSVKMYDKFGRILRIEVTTNDVSFFKHFRAVESRDGTVQHKIAPMRKTIHSFPELIRLMHAATKRYLDFISAIDDSSSGARNLEKATRTIRVNNQPYKGLNFFDRRDLALLHAIARGEYTIGGFRNRDIRSALSSLSSYQVTRILKRFRLHGLIKRVRGTLKYYLTRMGKRVVCLGMKLRETLLIPQLASC